MARRKRNRKSKTSREIEELIAELEADVEKFDNAEVREAIKEVIQELKAENDFLDEVERSL